MRMNNVQYMRSVKALRVIDRLKYFKWLKYFVLAGTPCSEAVAFDRCITGLWTTDSCTFGYYLLTEAASVLHICCIDVVVFELQPQDNVSGN